MSLSKPYRRNYRAIKPGKNSGYSDWAYIRDKEYAKSPDHYVRAFLMIQQDLQKLFEYVEPSEECLKTYSYRIHALLIRTCIEIEANFKAILNENIFTPEINQYGKPILNIGVYKIINSTHRLSSYEVMLPIWNGDKKIFQPFQSWKEKNGVLNWYQAYNDSKHDRQDKFKLANIENLLDAVTALLILLSSQFKDEDFSPGTTGLAIEGHDYYDFDNAIGSFFRIKFPHDWDESEKYDFDWNELKNNPNRFEKINYDLIIKKQFI